MEFIYNKKDFMVIDENKESEIKEEKRALVKECYKLRGKFELMNISEDELIISALKMYERQKNRVIRNKLKREIKE